MNPVALPPKLALLIPRLGSTFDPEIVATAKAIERTLKAAGRDWHDLARAVDVPAPAPAPMAPSWRRPWRPDHDATTSWREMAQWLHLRRDQLTDREAAFVVNVLDWRGQPTERQREWLDAIFTRIRERQ